MALGRTNLDDICEQDLVALIENGVEEDLTIEYKSAIYGRSGKDKIEFLKDVSALANTHGGHIVIGIKDIDGKPVEITPFNVDNIDNEKARLESLLRDRLDPRVNGIRLKVISISEKGYVLVLRVPESWNPPHGIKVDGRTIFYIRNSSGAHPASVEELRVLFTASATAYDRARAFRQERLAKITSGETPVRLKEALMGTVVLHIVPLSAFASPNQLDPRQVMSIHQKFEPLGQGGATARYNFDGVLKGSAYDDFTAYTQLFRNGSIEAVLKGIVFSDEFNQKYIKTAQDFFILRAVNNYLNGTKNINIDPPFIIMITYDAVKDVPLDSDYYDRCKYLENCNGLNTVVSRHCEEPLRPIVQPTLELPEIMIEDYGNEEDYERALKPAFDALWNAAGAPKAPYFDNDGRLKPASLRS